MGMTIAEKILAAKSGNKVVRPNDLVTVDVDTTIVIDNNCMLSQWREILKVADPDKIIVVFDHRAPASTVASAAAHATGREFVKRFGIKRFHDIGGQQGIAHQLIADHGYALPGGVLLCGDSHTCNAGVFNCLARGVGTPDVIFAVTTGKAWFKCGATVRYELSGTLSSVVTAKDAFLQIAGVYGDHATMNVEYGGPGLAGLSINARKTLTTMSAELSAEFATFEPDQVMIDWIKARNPLPFEPVYPDADAQYHDIRHVDLNMLEPLVAFPDTVVENSRPVSDAAGTKVLHRVLCEWHAGRSGACRAGAGGQTSVTRYAPDRHPRVPERLPRGKPSWHHRHAASGGGDHHARDLRGLRRRQHGRAWPERDLHHRHHPQFQGAHGRSFGAHLHGIARNRGRLGHPRGHHRSARIHQLTGAVMKITARVWKFPDNINTDLILPILAVYMTPEEQARYVFNVNRPGWVNEVRPGDIIIGGKNFGMGSSRPAARSLKTLGLGCLVAGSINGLFFRNAVNWAFPAMECPDVDTIFEEGQTAEVDIDNALIRNLDTGAEMVGNRIPDKLLDIVKAGGIYELLEGQGLIAPKVAAVKQKTSA